MPGRNIISAQQSLEFKQLGMGCMIFTSGTLNYITPSKLMGQKRLFLASKIRSSQHANDDSALIFMNRKGNWAITGFSHITSSEQ